MVKEFRKSACFLTVLSLLFSFSFSAGSSYAMEKQSTSKVLSSSQVADELEDDYTLNIDWGFDEEAYLDSEEDDLEENGFYYIVNDRNEAVITAYYDVEYDETGENYEVIGNKNLVIPDTLGGYPVAMIYDSAFCWLEITESITIPEGVKVIGEDAFSSCPKLNTINIPSTVTAIDSFAFSDEESLEKIVIPDSVFELGVAVFTMNGALKEVTLPSNLKSIPIGTFLYCESLQKINIPDSVKTIEDFAFAATGFTEFTVPETVATIGDNAFAGCENLVKVTIPKSVTKIGEGIFEECAKTVTIYGEKGSYAETYASTNKIPFKAINDTPEPELPVIATGVTTSTLKVRDGAGTGYAQIDYLAKGTKLEIVEKCSNGWYKIKNNGSYGYVSGKYVRLDTTEELPVIATGVTTSTLKVRNGAGTDYAQIDYLAKGTKLEIVEKCSNGWYKIKNNGSYGYVSGKYVKLDSSEEETVIATGVTTGDLNVRKGASTEYARIGTLTKGTKVEIVEKCSNGWYKIKYNGSYGYVSGKYVQLDGQVSEVIAIGVTTAGLNVRKGAGTDYVKIGYLAKGTTVEVVAKLSSGWYKIKYNGSYGYVSGAYVKLS
ncbi:MAG: SH3 domain-containing protein [Intestinibacter sp.]|uniref:SH3 domain-containing protein n=1 Tax=Intestinibacter sp. TaxID=1965304 RepID=UPI003F1731BB